MKYLIVSLLASSITLLSFTAEASALKPKPGQTSTTCQYNDGPKAGEVESFKDKAKPVLIGKPCADGQGNSGIAVFDKEDEEAEEAEEAAKAAALAAKLQERANVPLAANCQYKQGPKAGQTESFAGKQPSQAVGSACSDGLRSVGVVVP